jgi:hypothetical protein
MARSAQLIRGRGPSKYSELMAQNQDLDLLGGVGAYEKNHPAQEFGERQIDQPQRHGAIMPGCRQRWNSRSTAVGRVSGTHSLVEQQRAHLSRIAT